VRQEVNSATWLETKGVLCPHCQHFDPQAAQRHFPEGYLPFVHQGLQSSEIVRGSALPLICLALLVLVLVAAGGLCWLIAVVGHILGQEDLVDWSIFAALATLLTGTLFLSHRVRSAWQALFPQPQQRVTVERALATLDVAGLHELVVRLYHAAGDSLDLLCSPDQVREILTESAARPGQSEATTSPRPARFAGVLGRVLPFAMILASIGLLAWWSVAGFLEIRRAAAVNQQRHRLAEQDTEHLRTLSAQQVRTEEKEERDRQAAIFRQAINLIPECRRTTLLKDNRVMRLRTLVWDLTADEPSYACQELPPEYRGRSTDSNLTLFMTRKMPEKRVWSYKDGTGAYVDRLEVFVAYWPEKKAVGRLVIEGAEPPGFLSLRENERFGRGFRIVGGKVTGESAVRSLAQRIKLLKLAPASEFALGSEH
jgi:hypothetical protein